MGAHRHHHHHNHNRNDNSNLNMETLGERAAFMRESLQKSQIINDQVVAILGSFDHRLSALETAMRPTQVFLILILIIIINIRYTIIIYTRMPGTLDVFAIRYLIVLRIMYGF